MREFIRFLVPLIALAVVGLAVAWSLQGCERPTCPGLERVSDGSNCRELSTGKYVDRNRCEECGI